MSELPPIPPTFSLQGHNSDLLKQINDFLPKIDAANKGLYALRWLHTFHSMILSSATMLELLFNLYVCMKKSIVLTIIFLISDRV